MITGLESKVLVYLLMKNKSIETMDLSGCIDENSENFVEFFVKMDQSKV